MWYCSFFDRTKKQMRRDCSFLCLPKETNQRNTPAAAGLPCRTEAAKTGYLVSIRQLGRYIPVYSACSPYSLTLLKRKENFIYIAILKADKVFFGFFLVE